MSFFSIMLPTYRPKSGGPGEICALKIAEVFQNPRGYELHFADRRYAPIQVPWDMTADEAMALPGQYWVWLADGNQFASPAEVLEDSYMRVQADEQRAVIDVLEAYQQASRRPGHYSAEHRELLVRSAAFLLSEIHRLDTEAGLTQPVPEGQS